MMLRRFVLIACLLVSATALAVEPDEMMADPALEARAREISQHLRCVVCQNQSIDDSNADLAHDMRLLVRERLQAGDSDQEVVDYVVARYGNFVLLRPPVQADTLALWLAPFAALAAALLTLFLRQSRRTPIQPLTPEERATLRQRLGDSGIEKDS